MSSLIQVISNFVTKSIEMYLRKITPFESNKFRPISAPCAG
jgi:hypothetical protein